MSPELETLNQLEGGDLPLTVIHGLYPDSTAFRRGVHGLLNCGEVQLMEDGSEVPQWRWRGLFDDGEVMERLGAVTLSITERGEADWTMTRCV